MAFPGVCFHAHEGYGMFSDVVKKPRKGELRDHDAVVPLPNRVPSTAVNGSCPNMTWYTQVRKVMVSQTSRFDDSPEIRLAEFRLVHADRVETNIEDRPHAD